MNKKQKLMLSGDFRKNLSTALEDVRFRDTEIIVMHYDDPVAKLVGLSDKEIHQIKTNMQNKKDEK